MTINLVTGGLGQDDPAEISPEPCDVGIEFERLALFEELKHHLLADVVGCGIVQTFELCDVADNAAIAVVKLIPRDLIAGGDPVEQGFGSCRIFQIHLAFPPDEDFVKYTVKRKNKSKKRNPVPTGHFSMINSAIKLKKS